MDKNNNLVQLWANDAKRKAFIEAYKEWGEWLRVPELELIFFRYTLPNGDIIIAMEHQAHSFYRSSKGEWKSDVRYYLQGKGQPFTPSSNMGIWSVADQLKSAKIQMQQEMKK